MTGFAGLIGAAGSRPDPGLTAGIASAIARIGPDRQDCWQKGEAFLARSLLATTWEEEGDRQPLSLDGTVHLVADARIDGREELIRKLRGAGRPIDESGPDSALILHAWHVWGERCCEHLIGDFAFAIWDARTRRLFAARDPFGTVPFYFARIGEDFVFGNAVPALLAHPGLDRALNRTAIADYLMFGYSVDRDAGFYRHIHRLPPAQCLTLEGGEVRCRTYWTLPEPDFGATEKEKPEAIVEEFGAVFASAVRDRLRTDRVATTLSGGMDSTMVAGTALREAGARTRIQAYSFGGDWLLPDNERHWAWLCAHHLGLPFHSISVERAFTDPPGGHFQNPPEPRMELRTSSYQLIGERLAASGTRVLLMGMGGDTITGAGFLHWSRLLRERRFGRLAGEARRYWDHHRRVPPLHVAWRLDRGVGVPPMIAQFDPDFAREQQVEARWRSAREVRMADPRRMMAEHPFWTEMFVASHPESSGYPIRVRQPMFDVRLLELAMRVPPSPWQFGKALLRRLGEGMLPPEILVRPKTPFGLNIGWEAARRGLEPWLATLPDAPELEGIVDRSWLRAAVKDVATLPSQHYSGTITLPASLAAWMRANGAG